MLHFVFHLHPIMKTFIIWGVFLLLLLIFFYFIYLFSCLLLFYFCYSTLNENCYYFCFKSTVWSFEWSQKMKESDDKIKSDKVKNI